MRVSILGCGWLGAALGKHLLESGFPVKGSVTNPDKLDRLEQAGIKAFLVNVSPTLAANDDSDFWNADALVVASNVNLQLDNQYTTGLQTVARIVESKNIRRVIIVSSSSVYGEPNDIVDEHARADPQTSSAKRLLEIEGIFQNIPGAELSILRCAGLVGPGRMPGSFLAGKQNISNGLAPVNLIHQSDVVGIIQCLLTSRQSIGILNAVAADHPSRNHFYTTAARMQGLSLPAFILEKNSWKIVSSTIVQALGYTFQVDNWERWLSDPDWTTSAD